MLLRLLAAIGLIIGLMLPTPSNAMADSGMHCVTGTVSTGDGSQSYTYCWWWEGVGGGGGGGGYSNPDLPPGGGGGGTGLPPKAGYKVVGNVYVRLDRREILAQHAYSCATEHEVMAGVAQWSGGTTVGWQVEIQLADGKSQTWVRTNTSSYGWQPLTPCQ